MCGITGFIGKDPKHVKREKLERMAAAISHRGPDGWGRYVSDDVGLANTRLSIIDLVTGDQPVCSERSVIVCNGEIYNYIELRKELSTAGMLFHTESDTEVAQKAIEYWGTDAFARFNGQFAILFWDKTRRELTVARDHYGIRPLFYSIVGDRAVFASEMKAIDASGFVRRTWNPTALLTHGLFWNTLGEETVFNKVSTIQPGSWAVFSRDARRIRHGFYYRLGEHPPEVPDTYEDAKREFRSLLESSVAFRLRADVPVGAYLSGGIDSSVTSALSRAANGDRFKSFSVAFDDPAYDESEFQILMSKQLGTEHYSSLITVDTINDHFLDAARHFERPVFRTAPVPLFMLSQCVRDQSIKVVLTGEAADEILCGYDVFKEVKLLDAWDNGLSTEQIDCVLRKLYPHLEHYADGEKSAFMRMYYEGFVGKVAGPAAGLVIRLHNNQILAKYLNDDWHLETSNGEAEDQLASTLPDYVLEWPAIKRNQYLEMKTLLEGYLLSSQGDRMAMAHGVEGRFPFLDPRLVEWAFAIPVDWKLNGYQQKFILRDAFRDELPDAITNRPKRPYMAPDLVAFIRNGQPTDNARRFLDPAVIKDFGIFNPRMVERLLHKYFRRGTGNIGYRDNMLVSFVLSTQMAEHWIRNPLAPVDFDDRLCTVDVQEHI